MAKKAKKLPSEKDAFSLLNAIEYGNSNSSRVQALRQKEEAAAAALDRFTKTNREYRRLQKNLEDAREAHFEARWEEDDKRKEEVKKLRSQIWLLGVTPQLIQKVEKLLTKYGVFTQAEREGEGE